MINARHFETGDWLEIDLDGSTIRRIRRSEQSPRTEALDSGQELWVAPAFYDIQTNGRWGHSYSSPELTIDQVVDVALAQRALGTARFCPTLITASIDDFRHGVQTIAAACASAPDVDAMILGIHLEGPFLSERDGYRGAHPAIAIRDPDWSFVEEVQRVSGNRVVMMTLAPERPGSAAFIRRATEAGIRIALGHTAASGEMIREAVEAGATLSTHLGNGIVSELARHPNPIWNQAAEDRLSASFIADGHHVDLQTLRVLTRSKGIARSILVSDASPLAGLPPGTYGQWAVDPSGKIVVAGTPYLAGSNQGLETGIRNYLKCDDHSILDAIQTVTANPARFLGFPAPTVAEGAPANLVLFTRESGFTLRETYVDGVRVPAG